MSRDLFTLLSNIKARFSRWLGADYATTSISYPGGSPLSRTFNPYPVGSWIF